MGQDKTVNKPVPDEWLGKKLLDENSLAYRTAWDLYLKFYTVFLTVNILAIGTTVQYISQGNRWPITVIFVGSNLIGIATSAFMARFSYISGKRYEDICRLYIESSTEAQHNKLAGLGSAPLPGWLGNYCGYACVMNLLLFAICWVMILWIPSR
jgi:hypothetical protein